MVTVLVKPKEKGGIRPFSALGSNVEGRVTEGSIEHSLDHQDRNPDPY